MLLRSDGSFDGDATYDVTMSHPSRMPATGPTTVSQDFLAAALGALMPLGGGLLVLLLYTWMGPVGVLLGLGGSAAWGYWWYNKHQAFFPKNLRGGSVGGIAGLVVLLAVLFFAGL